MSNWAQYRTAHVSAPDTSLARVRDALKDARAANGIAAPEQVTVRYDDLVRLYLVAQQALRLNEPFGDLRAALVEVLRPDAEVADAPAYTVGQTVVVDVGGGHHGDGEVLEVVNRTLFRVALRGGKEILAYSVEFPGKYVIRRAA